MRLFHFTTARLAQRIGRYGVIVPHPQQMFHGVRLAWFTSDPTLPREALGLTSYTIPVDRMEVLFEVTDTRGILSFWDWCDLRRMRLDALAILNESKRPDAWFVSERAVIVTECCGCGALKSCRNLIALRFHQTEPGIGWGCVVCNLAPHGAVSVVCDDCIELGVDPEFMVCGTLPDLRRVPLPPLEQRFSFEHDREAHRLDDMRCAVMAAAQRN